MQKLLLWLLNANEKIIRGPVGDLMAPYFTFIGKNDLNQTD